MKFIKKSYYYFFYKIYRSIEYTSKSFGGANIVKIVQTTPDRPDIQNDIRQSGWE
ncbi:hypothetical protein [Flavobacterium sp. ENC]|uniref:hypothetical protein n=1 Tax=Flavobacterium sp. ENC TaxID=2897330 RepID=UPI001E49310A|nr:hypothetical protein [Flavobacterium sp. ENC]MCD0467648.1 hypothetical protein [Flavobacterium sp. ENC]